ncbi:Glycosyltransferase involved in cell wall bisynthesis [Thiohalomonas denitrificans]|uniref:Glycosyltransferase involved in cell wall bisynthesis n=1 Tax=Thiohalomonas denitrificans TaxID=415747 RepID=A0A1G5R1L0_9GAMM|nr:Glycosyltransferase involved in cell wall bisynthesis [Thiohalomonas denitrificans]
MFVERETRHLQSGMSDSGRKKICHVISSLELGGAQQLLLALTHALSAPEFEHIVISLTRETDLARRLEALGCRVHCIGITGPRSAVMGFCRVARLLRQEQPDIVQTWLYHADLLGGLAAKLSGSRPIIWSVHHASPDGVHEKGRTWLIVKALAFLSYYIPDSIVYCSDYAKTVHEMLGYRAKPGIVINNGVNTDRFRPAATLRKQFRQELLLEDHVRLVGMVARFSPIKGFDVFLEMAESLKASIPQIQFVLAGTEVLTENPDLVRMVESSGLSHCCYLLGERTDIESIMNGLDVLVCPSYSESFGLVVAEALACGVPVIASDVEVLRRLVGDRYTSPVGVAEGFAEKVREVLMLGKEGRDDIGSQGRERIVKDWGNCAMFGQYRAHYQRATK